MNITIDLSIIILTIYIFFCTYTDIKSKKISLPLSVVAALIILLVRIYSSNFLFNISTIILPLIPGFILFIVALITRQAVGYGDCIVILISGLGTSLPFVTLMCILSFSATCIYSLFIIATRKASIKVIPFVPFILFGFILSLFFKVNIY